MTPNISMYSHELVLYRVINICYFAQYDPSKMNTATYTVQAPSSSAIQAQE